MSKTFKSTEGGFSIGIHPVKDGVQFRITNMRGNYQQFNTPASVAAEQALAILEAAGLTVAKDDFKEGSFEDVMIDASLHLKSAIRLQERITAAAEAQAELEAEALELFNTLQVEIHGILGPNWVNVTEFPNIETKRKWLAVARRAREMRAKK